MRNAAAGAAVAQGKHSSVNIMLALRGLKYVEKVVLRPLEIPATEVVANKLARLIVERKRHGSSGRLRDRDRALSCRPPVTLPWSTDGRPPVSLTDAGGRRLGRSRAPRGGSRSAPMPC